MVIRASRAAWLCLLCYALTRLLLVLVWSGRVSSPDPTLARSYSSLRDF